MDKMPTKQIYLLLVLVFGIVSFSAYSTYSMFTLESSSEDIVSIHTPNNLNILNNTYEYQQVRVASNTYVTTDLDVYNNMNDELCYGVWYKIITNDIDNDKVKVYQNTDNSLTTNSVISGITSRRISVIIINDNNQDIIVNVGIIYDVNNGFCQLNVPSDKTQIISTIGNPRNLVDTIINNTKNEEKEEGYLIYSYSNGDISFDNDKKIYISNDFTLSNEEFQIKEMIDDQGTSKYKEISFEDIINYQDYYTCFDNEKCDLLYHIKNVIKENDISKITSYELLVPYMKSENGLRKVDNNYYFYGDNPNNFVYYNCENELDNKTCELWRIIGFVDDNGKYLTKLIRDDSIGKYKYDNQLWESSNIANYLNNDYKVNDKSLIKENSFKQENIINLDVDKNSIDYLNNTNKGKVLLMSLSDYLNASVCDNRKINEYTGECISKNWLNNKLIGNEYTLSVKYQDRVVDEEENEITPLINNIVYAVNNNINEVEVSESLDIRPVVHLSNRTLLTSGEGTFESPYVLR